MLTLALLANPAFAAADLITTITEPSGVYVYDSSTWSVYVYNQGNQTAANTVVTIQLPLTHTSPSVYPMGTVGALSSGCTRSSGTITCTIGNLAKKTGRTVTFGMAFPQNDGALTVTSTASTTSSENTANNGDSEVVSSVNYAVSFTGDRNVGNSHCTGTSLTSYFECTLFPSSISTHDAVFHGDGTITFPTEPTYWGAWTQPTSTTLEFTYSDSSGVVATFSGAGTGGDCWEGITHFTSSSYVSPYEVCLQ